MSKYKDYVYVIPEDDKNRQIAVGFEIHHRVNHCSIKVIRQVGGWSKVLETFKKEYIQRLRNHAKSHVIMLIDFDKQFDQRWKDFQDAIPIDLKPRVFVIGSIDEPETLVKALKMRPEEIGKVLADDCDAGQVGNWSHEHLVHNEPERKRLEEMVKPFLFER